MASVKGDIHVSEPEIALANSQTIVKTIEETTGTLARQVSACKELQSIGRNLDKVVGTLENVVDMYKRAQDIAEEMHKLISIHIQAAEDLQAVNVDMSV